MDYQEKIKKVLARTSVEAQKIVAITMRIEAQKRWQEDHKGLSKQVVDAICSEVSGLVR